MIKFDEKWTVLSKSIGQCKVYILKLVFMVDMNVSNIYWLKLRAKRQHGWCHVHKHTNRSLFIWSALKSNKYVKAQGNGPLHIGEQLDSLLLNRLF